ncbi:hypothetical protein LXA43DRAFT_1065680 [Ganoderma leucocontextum]|nr:hypothetical protein LXA43DRAFT_1065680 [Ganoderma leucocontextum]
MADDNPRKPMYGDPDAALRDFRQKNKPHLAFAELVGDDQKTMEYCPVYGQPWGVQSEPLPEENLQNYRRRKERERERKEAEAKGAVSKKKRKSRKKAIVQPDTPAVYAPATALPAPEPPTTQWAMHSDGRTPSTSPPHAVAQAYSADPNWIPLTTLAQHPPPGATFSTPGYSYHPTPAPVRTSEEHTMGVLYSDTSQVAYMTTLGPGSGGETLSDTRPSALSNVTTVHSPTGVLSAREGSIAEYTMPSNSYASTYIHQVADQASTTFSNSLPPDHDPLAAPRYTFPGPYHSSHGPSDELVQYGAGVPYPYSHVASQGLYTTTHRLSSDPDSTYAVDHPYTAQPPVPAYSEAGGESPWIGSSSSPPGTWAESPGWDATPPLHHTAPQPNPGLTAAHNSVGGTNYVSAAYQGFSPADRRLLGSRLSNIVPAVTPEMAEYYLKVDGGYVPQAHPPTMIDNRFGAIAYHGVGEQDPQVVQGMVQATPPPQGGHRVVWSAPSAVAPYIDRERSYDIERMVDDTYAYNQDVPVQYQPATPPSTCNACPSTQSSYSELSKALHYPAYKLMDECAPSSMENLATSPWYIVPPASADAGFYACSSSGGFSAESAVPLPPAQTYAQDLTMNHAQPAPRFGIQGDKGYSSEDPVVVGGQTSTFDSYKPYLHGTRLEFTESSIECRRQRRQEAIARTKLPGRNLSFGQGICLPASRTRCGYSIAKPPTYRREHGPFAEVAPTCNNDSDIPVP